VTDATETLWSGRFLEIRRRDGWEWAARRGEVRAAVILAIHDGAVILVEQDRIPLGCRSLELPAGLVGDDADAETPKTAAARELEEETGWRAARVEALGIFASSPGMTSETFTLVRATGLTRVGAGGGVAGERIAVHAVPLAELTAFVAARRAAGVAIDARLLLVLASTLTSHDRLMSVRAGRSAPA